MRLENGDIENIDFAKTLLEIGTMPNDVIQLHLAVNKCKDIQELIYGTYPGLNHPSTSTPAYLTERTILDARNEDVNDINLAALNAFPGEEKTYYGADSMEDVDARDPTNTNQVPLEYLNSLEPYGLPPYELKLKVGCPIMALRNIAPKDGVCKGTRLKVIDVSDHVINEVVLTGDKAGREVFIPRISLTPSSTEILVLFTRRHYPFRLAFSMFINKSQGQSVKYVGVDLQRNVFSHGQLYVALSRCTSSRKISVMLPYDADNETTNIVYPEGFWRKMFASLRAPSLRWEDMEPWPIQKDEKMGRAVKQDREWYFVVPTDSANAHMWPHEFREQYFRRWKRLQREKNERYRKHK